MAKQRVILFGKSLILGTLSASLKRYPDMEIVILSPPLPGTEELAALAPDVILFDVVNGRPEAAFALLKSSPNLLLVSVNPESDQIEIWSSGQASALTTGDLVRLISQGGLGYPRDRPEQPATYSPTRQNNPGAAPQQSPPGEN